MGKRWLFVVIMLLLILGMVVSPGASTVGAQNNYVYYFPIFNHDDQVTGFTSIGPDGGTVTSLVIHPRDPDILYAGTWGNGIYKSIDGGAHWTHKSAGFRAGFVFDLAIDPEHPHHLLASAYRFGAYESFNGGESWEATSGMPGETVVYAFDFHPTNSDIVYAAVRTKTVYDPDPHYPGAVYQSTNGGSHWEKKSHGLPDDYVYDVAVDPNSPSVLYAAMHETGVYKSVDGAATWTSVNNNIHYRDARSIAINPQDSTIYVGMYDGKGVTYSTNGGASWTTIASSVNQALYVYKLQLDPYDQHSLYLNTPDGLFRCQGDPYPASQSACERLAHDDRYVFALALDKASAQGTGKIHKLYTGLQTFGIQKSTDAGQSFTASYNGLKSTVILSVLNDPSAPDTLYASVLGRGVYKSSDAGQSWQALRDGLPSQNVNTLVFRPGTSNVIYAGTQQDGIYISTNSGQSWSPANTGMTQSRQVLLEDNSQFAGAGFNHPSYAWMDPVDIEGLQVPIDAEKSLAVRASYPEILTLRIHPTDTAKMFMGTAGKGVLKSDDFGQSWAATELTWGDVYASLVDLSQAVFKFHAGVSTAGTRGSDVAMTAWPARNTGFHPDANVYGLALRSSGKYYAATDKGIYWTNNAGGTWSLVGFSNLRFNDVFVHPDRPGEVWAASSDGLYRSTDGGHHWERVGHANLNDQFLTISRGYGAYSIYFGMSGGNICRFGQ